MTNLTNTETDSDWIGDIPDNWSLEKLKYIFSEKKSTSNSDLQCGSISFGKVIFKNDDKVPDSTKQSYQEVLEGEFVINPLNLNFDLKSLRIGLSKISVVMSQGYIVLKINDGYLPSYYEYLLRKFDVEHMKSLGQGVRQTISFTHIKDEKLVVPPPGEQQLISRYLDKKTEQIDSLVEKVQKKIELLKEQRTSLINQCVTKGLDPNVEMKDSGVEWIGEIPSHWSVKKLPWFVFFQEGPGLRNWQFTDHGVRVVCVTNITTDGLNFDQYQRYISEDEYLSSYKHFTVETGDLLLASSGNSFGKLCRYSGEFDNEFILNTSTIRLHSLDEKSLKTEYLKLLIESEVVQTQIRILITGSAQPNFGPTHLNKIKIPIPTDVEQEELLVKVEPLLKDIDVTIKKEYSRISLIKEYRQSLISSVVTGKVRVTEDMI